MILVTLTPDQTPSMFRGYSNRWIRRTGWRSTIGIPTSRLNIGSGIPHIKSTRGVGLARFALVSLRYRSVLVNTPFRNFLIGSVFYGLGSSMVQLAVAWLALDLAPEGLEGLTIGITLGAYVAPGMVVGLVLGGWARRLGARKLLLLDVIDRLAFLGAIPLLFVLNLLNLVVLVSLLAGASLFRSLGSAGYRSIAPLLLDPEDRLAANSLLWGLADMGTIVGPVVGGVLTAVVGPTLAIGLSLPPGALLIPILLTMRLRYPAEVPKEGSTGRSSLATMASYPRLAALLALTFAFFVASGPLEVALPVYVDRELAAGPELLGALWSAFGIGLVLGTILVGGVSRLRPGRALVSIVLGWGVAMIFLGLLSHPVEALVLLFLAGFIFSPYDPIAVTVVQSETRAEDLATVNTAWASVLLAASPIGLFIAGPPVDTMGARGTFLVSGVATGVVGIVSALLMLYQGTIPIGPKLSEAARGEAVDEQVKQD